MKRAFATAATLGIVLAAPLAHATVMVPLGIEEMAAEADAFVRGVVRAQRGAWDAKKQRIYTIATLEILESVSPRVALPATIEVRSLGGVVGEIGMHVAGSPSFRDGDEVALFLVRDPTEAGAFRVVGMNQGKFAIDRRADGAVLAAPTLEGIALLRPGSAEPALRAVGTMTWTDLRARVERVRAVRPASSPRPETPATAPSDAPLDAKP